MNDDNSHRNTPRFLLLVTVSIAGMVLLGIAAHLTVFLTWGGDPLMGSMTVDELAVTLLIAVVVAGSVGVMSMPWTISFLADADLRKALPMVYGVSLIVTILSSVGMPDSYGVYAAIPAFLSVVITSWFAGRRFPLPPRPPAPEQPCPRCGYDLQGQTARGCPECGWLR